MSYACAYKDVALVRSFTGIPISDSTNWRSQITQDLCCVRPHHGNLRDLTYAQGPPQCYWLARGRRISPLDYADWASTTCG